MNNFTRHKLDNIITCYEQATIRKRGSPGGWHGQLVAAVRDAGYEVRDYEDAKEKAEEVIRAYTRTTR